MTSIPNTLVPEMAAEKCDQPAGGLAYFTVLWIVWAALLIAAMVLGNFSEGHGSAAATAARMGSSVALVVTGWLAYATWRHTSAGNFALCIATGMTLGTIGDFFNANLLTFVPLKDPVLGGILAFGLGHAAYIVGCKNLATRAGLNNFRALTGAIVVWQLIGLVGWYFVAMQGTKARDLVWPALPYSLLLAGTAGISSGLAIQCSRFIPLALGGALFLTSDLILAFGMFGGHVPHQTEWVWLTYGPGQMLIVFSTISAANALRNKRVASKPA